MFYSLSDQKLQEGEGHTVSSTENKEFSVMVHKIQYMPPETKIICTSYMHFKEPEDAFLC